MVVVGWVVAGAFIAVLAFFAGRWTLSPPVEESEERPPAIYTVAEGTVGRSLDVSVSVTWPVSGVAVNGMTGVITSLDAGPGERVDVGAAVYSVDLRPVVIAEGAVPSFREMRRGAIGADVAQLQRFLASQGYAEVHDDGVFGTTTVAAVRAWQRDSGLNVTGVVEVGGLVFVPSLPARIDFDEAFVLGARVVPGQTALTLASTQPQFAAEITADGVGGTVIPGSRASVNYDSGEWGAVTGAVEGRDGGRWVPLLPATGDSICAEECDVLPFSSAGISLSGNVDVVPSTTGPVVPVSAVGTAASGDTYVLTEAGDRHPVSVLASDGSMSVVEGLAAGATVRLFAVPAVDVTPTAGP